jgi:hypothetical protein
MGGSAQSCCVWEGEDSRAVFWDIFLHGMLDTADEQNLPATYWR